MARDKGLEALVNDVLEGRHGFTQKAMFGGWAWLSNGNIVYAARTDGMLLRLGKDNDAWALEIDGIGPMISRGKPMNGWVRASPQVYANDVMRHKLLRAALDFVQTLPPKF